MATAGPECDLAICAVVFTEVLQLASSRRLPATPIAPKRTFGAAGWQHQVGIHSRVEAENGHHWPSRQGLVPAWVVVQPKVMLIPEQRGWLLGGRAALRLRCCCSGGRPHHRTSLLWGSGTGRVSHEWADVRKASDAIMCGGHERGIHTLPRQRWIGAEPADTACGSSGAAARGAAARHPPIAGCFEVHFDLFWVAGAPGKWLSANICALQNPRTSGVAYRSVKRLQEATRRQCARWTPTLSSCRAARKCSRCLAGLFSRSLFAIA